MPHAVPQTHSVRFLPSSVKEPAVCKTEKSRHDFRFYLKKRVILGIESLSARIKQVKLTFRLDHRRNLEFCTLSKLKVSLKNPFDFLHVQRVIAQRDFCQ